MPIIEFGGVIQETIVQESSVSCLKCNRALFREHYGYGRMWEAHVIQSKN